MEKFVDRAKVCADWLPVKQEGDVILLLPTNA